MASNYEYNVLSGLFSNKISKVKGKVKGTFFTEKTHTQLFNFAMAFFRDTKTVPTFEVVEDHFKNKTWDVQEEMKALVAKLNPKIDDALFEHSVNKFLHEHKMRLVKNLQVDATNIQEERLNKFVDVAKKQLNEIGDVDNSNLILRETGEQEYAEDTITRMTTARPDSDKGIMTNNPIINKLTGGIRKKKLWVIAGAAGECKSTMLSNIAEEARDQGKHVFYVTVEMPEEQCMNNYVSAYIYKRHSRLIEVTKLEDPTLQSPQETALIAQAVKEIQSGVGQVTWFELPIKYSFANLEAKLAEVHQRKPVDLVCIDYLLLLKANERRVNQFEESEQLFKDCKALAMTFDDGKGIPIVTAHQINTEGIKRARKRGFYVYEDLAKTAEARNSPDVIICNFMDNKLREQNELKQNILKNRGGKLLTDCWICPVELQANVINPPLDTSNDDFIPENIKL